MTLTSEHDPQTLPATAGRTHDEAGETLIEPALAWKRVDLAELWRSRELILFLAWRDIKVRYKQTLLGAAWAILQPVLLMLAFTLVLGRVAGLPGGEVPYGVYVYSGLLPWMLFAWALNAAGQSVVSSERLISKVYFPRLAMPIAAVGTALIDFGLASLVLAMLLAWYGIAPGWGLLAAPLAVLLVVMTALGLGSFLAALNVAYRDVRYVLPFAVQLGLFLTPVIYINVQAIHSAEQRPVEQRPADGEEGTTAGRQPRAARWFDINPMNGLVAFFRAAVLDLPLPWGRVAWPAAAAAVALVGGTYYFRGVEQGFADVI